MLGEYEAECFTHFEYSYNISQVHYNAIKAQDKFFISAKLLCNNELICLLRFNVLVLESTCTIMMLPKLLEKKSSNNDQNELLTILCVSTLLYMCM
jgi:hypothetical protein